MDSMKENYVELWAAKRKEFDAKAERLSAEKRMEYNNAFDDFGAEVSAAADWTTAGWNELMAKADKKWQEFAIDMQD
jgi:hypothetical protein